MKQNEYQIIKRSKNVRLNYIKKGKKIQILTALL